jgi:hypothetical protein
MASRIAEDQNSRLGEGSHATRVYHGGMRLILLPCDPHSPGGYNRVAGDDLRKLCSRADDIVCVYLQTGRQAASGFRVIHRPSRGSFRQFANVLAARPFSDVWVSQLRPIVKGAPVGEIFCGDVIFYNALRALFPGHRMTVRFHNLFGLARSRWEWRASTIDTHFRLTLSLTSRLERKICSDPLVHPIFINPRERDFFQLMWPGRSSEVWGVDVVPSAAPSVPKHRRLLYMGGTASHQVVGIRLLLERVLPSLRSAVPGVEFHLWGEGTERFARPADGVFGHGFWRGEGLPLNGDGLFVIPDLLGGGIKVKTGDALREGLAFITTPFGAEGYDFVPCDGRIVAEMDQWAEMIAGYFKRNVAG